MNKAFYSWSTKICISIIDNKKEEREKEREREKGGERARERAGTVRGSRESW